MFQQLLLETDGGLKRHVKVYSYPEPNTISSNEIFVSPLMVFNLKSPRTIKISKPSNGTFPISRFVRIAKEVTISRLASPVTTDRSFQQSFLSGLRTYFESCCRVVRINDIIAVPIDTVLAQTLYGSTDMGAVPAGRPNDVAWFKITSLIPGKGSGEDDEPGDVECIIDPSHTRMVQSGLVTGPHPSTLLGWRSYLSLDRYPNYGQTLEGDGFSDKHNFKHAADLSRLLAASISPQGAALQTTILVHSSKRGAGKSTLLKSIASQLGIHVFEIDCYSVTGDNDTKTIGTLRARLDRASTISPCLVVLRHIDALAKKNDQDGTDGGGLVSNLVDTFEEYIGTSSKKKNSFILSATVADVDRLSEAVRSKFKFEITVSVPSESERKAIFKYLTEVPLPNTQLTGFDVRRVQTGFTLRNDVSLETLALQSAGLTPPDLVSIIDMSKQKAINRLQKVASGQGCSLRDLVLSSKGLVKITPEDIEQAIGEARSKYSDSIGAPKIPNVGWQDVGGLDGVKKEILDSIEMPLKFPQLFSDGIKKRSGILFYGPPGTGKTLLAKAIATTFSLNFFSVKGPELLNMYIGESEANVRKVFQKARDAKPCVVFFDELDSVAPKRGKSGDSGGVMDRIVSQLLAELDGMSGQGGDGVFVVGATNRPDLLDEALLRPGRFDKMLYLGISDTHDKQETILQALTRKFTLSPDVSLKQIAAKCPFTYTGADFYAMSSDAMLNAMTRTAGDVDAKIKQYNLEQRAPHNLPDVTTRWWFRNIATDDDVKVQVTEADFDKAQRELVPSVSAEELQHYLNVRASFEGGKKDSQQPPQLPSSTQPPASNRLQIQPTNHSTSTNPLLNGTTTTTTTSKGKGKAKITKPVILNDPHDNPDADLYE
ncbi:AAA family ATPase peroxin 6 [Sugiyamaella lignohabitans]|uniref:Peroxisomal ATPase PEX6 n=1 Tax=Sugiyamaella lignohabitans TaxID=796027 RepID=A0A167DHA3_9ASCO|nr:AAA family ATPase peroxin 6 [Sugiyamaella lignohabitans]ANB12919.1 AAA family ATPase peroxin 6 [Sugiyamaella lignohabitans]